MNTPPSAHRVGETLRQGGRTYSFEFFPPKTDEGEQQLWQALAELGQAFQGVEAEVEQLARQTPSPPQAPTDGVKPGRRQAAAEATGPSQQPPLDQAWAAFEAQQALEDLRRRQA